ncbi:unnamed protein product [Brachionus calyciflorus]|uniref:Uncharacterized protein n=1 Tax=Brachionus calyciflorus TaxID=104777 RepID=A0A814I4R3_9BILA|nr:unnamed protein product [Brachionus calyciflorus]
MSFYVTLPSNSSMDLYSENTMTDFTVLLKEPIRLEVQYKVALVELTYKHSSSLEVGQLYIQPLNRKSNKEIPQNIKIPKNPFTSDLRDENVVDEKISSDYFRAIPSFSSDPFRFIMYTREYRIRFDGDILRIFNLESKWYEVTGDKRYLESGKINDPSPNIINSLFIYTDIFDYQYLGDAYEPLLRNVILRSR